MAKSKAEQSVSPDLVKQREYVKNVKSSHFDFNLVVADAFIRGIRDIGYKHTGTALDELIDNGIQAEAQFIHVAVGFEGGSDKKPDRIAVIDDGHGMDPDMIRLSTIWGGTHREGDRKGFGRYGYGEPSAAVSQGHRFTVYSKVDGAEWHSVTIDIDAIGRGEYTNERGQVEVPTAIKSDVPNWIQDYLKERSVDLTHGTIVEIEVLDRLTWKTGANLKRHLLEHFGVTYRNFLREVDLYVDGRKVEAIDPLFLTPGFRYYDLDSDQAEALPPLVFEVKDSTGTSQAVKVRFSYMPPTFQRNDKSKEKGGKGNMNERFAIMRDHNGVIALRNGRQIDVVTTTPWGVFNIYDRNWGVEVDFPAALDEEFSITTSKQQIRLSERLWDALKEAGVYAAIVQMRARFKKDTARLKNNRDKDDGQRASEQAMQEAAKFKTKRPSAESEPRRKKSQEAFEKEAKKRAESAGIAEAEAAAKMADEAKERPYKVVVEDLPGAPFYRAEQVGGQRVLRINSAHRFYTDLYASPTSTPRLRAGLEVLLFVLGECELEATDERALFYSVERSEWSTRLNVTFDRLEGIDSVEDEAESNEDEALSA